MHLELVEVVEVINRMAPDTALCTEIHDLLSIPTQHHSYESQSHRLVSNRVSWHDGVDARGGAPFRSGQAGFRVPACLAYLVRWFADLVRLNRDDPANR